VRTAALTDAQGKAFKRGEYHLKLQIVLSHCFAEAMHLDGRAPGPTLQVWIESYVVPPPPKPPGYQTYYKRRRAELAAKKARIDTLMVMRARALESARRRWPQPRCLSKDHEKENRMRQMEEKAAREAAKAEKAACEAEEERAAAAARVATLMQMRATWEESRCKKAI
jgi:hypothetical protein